MLNKNCSIDIFQVFEFLYQIKNTITVAINKNINHILFIMKSEVDKSAFVANGNSIQESSKSGLIEGITYVKTILKANPKNKNIIIG